MEELCDVVAERAVLAGIYQHGADAYFDVADIVQTTSFTDSTNQVIFKCYKDIFEVNPDATIDQATFIATAEKLGVNELFRKQSENRHLRAIFNMQINLGNVRQFAAKIRKIQIRKRLVEINKETGFALEAAPKDASLSDLLSIVENPIFDLSALLNDEGSGPKRLGDGVADYISFLASNPREIVGISTGFKYFDKAIGGGCRRKTVNLIGARPKCGKSQIVDNVGFYVAKKLNIPVLNLDTEMDEEAHWNRVLANISNVTVDDIETGKFAKDPNDKRAVEEAGKILESVPYDYISIAGQPFEDTLAMMRRWLAKNVGVDENGRTKDCLIIYDYIKLMTPDGLSNMQEFQMLGFQMTSLHNFMVRYDVPCLAFIQLNRDGITKESTDAASGSDRLIWLCSNFTIFKTKSDEEIAEDGPDNGNRKLVPIVGRHGAGLNDGDYINFRFEGQFGRLTELGLNSQMQPHHHNQGFEVDDEMESDF